MSAPAGPAMLVHRTREDEDDDQFRPLSWGLIRRLFTYSHPVRARCGAWWC